MIIKNYLKSKIQFLFFLQSSSISSVVATLISSLLARCLTAHGIECNRFLRRWDLVTLATLLDRPRISSVPPSGPEALPILIVIDCECDEATQRTGGFRANR